MLLKFDQYKPHNSRKRLSFKAFFCSSFIFGLEILSAGLASQLVNTMLDCGDINDQLNDV